MLVIIMEATDAGDHFANGCESCSGETDGTGSIVNNVLTEMAYVI